MISWEGRWEKFLRGTLDEAVEAHEEYLRNFPSFHLRNFRRQRLNDEESAKGEAAARIFLKDCRLDVEPAESKKNGGLDYRCWRKPLEKRTGPQLLAEITSLRSDAVQDKSGWPETASAFSLITEQIQKKTDSKIPQIRKNASEGTVLIVTTVHPAGHVLMHGLPAKILSEASQELFIEWKEISGVILLALHWKSYQALGILNPFANVELDLRYFPDVPFVLKERWVISDPEPKEGLYPSADFESWQKNRSRRRHARLRRTPSS